MANRERKIQQKFYTNEDESENIKYKIVEANLSKQDYLLKCALGKKIIVIDGIGDLTREVKRIGVNLNQITHKVNAGELYDCRSELKGIHDELNKIWANLTQMIKQSK